MSTTGPPTAHHHEDPHHASTQRLPPSPGSLRFLLLLTLSLLPVQAAQPSQKDLAAYADQLFSVAFPADQPGAAVLVIDGGQVVLRKGYGLASVELGVPVAPEMVFKTASVTKQFTAAAILMLQEEGKLWVEAG